MRVPGGEDLGDREGIFFAEGLVAGQLVGREDYEHPPHALDPAQVPPGKGAQLICRHHRQLVEHVQTTGASVRPCGASAGGYRVGSVTIVLLGRTREELRGG